jgi:hypothetical protein
VKINTLLSASQFHTGPAIPVRSSRPLAIKVAGDLAVPVYVEAKNHIGFYVAKIIKEAGTYLIEPTSYVRASLAGANPSRVIVTMEY